MWMSALRLTTVPRDASTAKVHINVDALMASSCKKMGSPVSVRYSNLKFFEFSVYWWMIRDYTIEFLFCFYVK